MSPFKGSLAALKAGKFVICVKGTQRSGCLVVIGTPVFSPTVNETPAIQWGGGVLVVSVAVSSVCRCAGCPLLGHGASGAEGCGAAARGPAPLVWPDDGMVHRQMATPGLSCALQRWHGDGTEVFRLAAPRQASPPNSKP